MEHEVLVDSICQELEIQHFGFKEQSTSFCFHSMHLNKLNQGDLSEGMIVLRIIGRLYEMLNWIHADWQRINACHFIIHYHHYKGYEQMLNFTTLQTQFFFPECQADTPQKLSDNI